MQIFAYKPYLMIKVLTIHYLTISLVSNNWAQIAIKTFSTYSLIAWDSTAYPPFAYHIYPYLLAILVLKFEHPFCYLLMCVKKTAGRVANSVDPNQMLHLQHLIWVCTVCSDMSVPILRVIMVLDAKASEGCFESHFEYVELVHYHLKTDINNDAKLNEPQHEVMYKPQCTLWNLTNENSNRSAHTCRQQRLISLRKCIDDLSHC